jgi:hypothetical protein
MIGLPAMDKTISIVRSANEKVEVRTGSHKLEVEGMKHDQA